MMIMMKFLVLTTLVVMISPISTYADKNLMIKECHNARVPTICMQCLESDPTSLDADRIGIARIIINCLESRLHILTNNITKLLQEKVKSDAVKEALEGCKKDLTEAATKLPEAKEDLKTGDYDKAGQLVEMALGSPLSCLNSLKIAKFEKVKELCNQINIYAQISDAAMRIIDRF